MGSLQIQTGIGHLKEIKVRIYYSPYGTTRLSRRPLKGLLDTLTRPLH